jgi:predicted ATPase/tRNA A-37 threonylcarbamoyl transferase component Bud32
MSELWRERYEPLEIVGQGAQGSVVKALDHLHGRHVALKIRPVGPPEVRDALLSEARVLLELEPHPLITLVRDDFFLDDRYVLVMDWIAGESLAERRGASGTGSQVEDVVRWLAQVADALDHLHDHRPPVVHGDVKPTNILLTPEGKAVLVDFGIARSGTDTVRTGSGTAAFMAPELASGHTPTPAADVFSLAATAYFLLTGRPPAPGDRPDWTAIAGDRGGDVEMALRRGLATDPSRRPASAGELVQALRGRSTAPNNLPAALTSFVGRRAEVARVAARLAEVRLLTLTGAGGLGKTRLAVEVASEVLAAYPDGAFLVELAPLADPALVAQQMLAALGVAETEAPETEGDAAHGRPAAARPLARLVAELMTRRALLLVDNCEHLIEGCASVVDTLLRACPNLRILATSREPLRVPGETTWRVEPLSTPDPEKLPPVDELGEYEAVGLFVERAAAAAPGFRLTPANAAAVATVCAMVDGIPLAIELAAARTTVLTVEQIARRLDDRFRLLSGGSRTLPDRHQSLRAAIDWTYDALSGPEQTLFRRLSAFSGGFSLEAAERVAPDESLGEPDVLELLSSLVDKSLVVSDGVETGRYRMLETLRQYGADRLETAGEAPALEHRHLEWALALAEEARPHLGRSEGPSRLAALEADHDNLRAALDTAAEAGGEKLSRLVVALGPFWRTRGYLEEGRAWVEVALSPRDGAPAGLRQGVLAEAGALASHQGDFKIARAWFEESLGLAEEGADTTGAIQAREGLARVLSVLGDNTRARSLHDENLSARRRAGDQLGVAESLLDLVPFVADEESVASGRELLAESVAILRTLDQPATLARALTRWGQRSQGEDPVKARAALEEALALHERLGDRLGMADALGALANLEQVQANFAEAHELFERVLAIRRESGNRANLANALYRMAQLTQYREDHAGSRRLFLEAIEVAAQIGDTHGEANALEGLGSLYMFEGDFASARPYLERALGLVRARGDRNCEQQALMSLGDAAWGEGDGPGAMALYREAARRAGAVSQKIRLMYCLERLGSAGALGDFERAARLLGAAQAIRDAVGHRRPLYSVPEWDQDVAMARDALGDAAFEAAWAEGQAMPFDELVRYAVEEPAAATSVLAHRGGGRDPLPGDAAPDGDGAGNEQAE